MSTTAESEHQQKAAMEWAASLLHQLPKGDPAALELHLTAVLIVFWGALWGTLGTDYARDFIAAQLRGMETEPERWTPPKMQ